MKRISACLFILLWGVLLLTPILSAPLFPDVPSLHWASDAVRELADKGILEGYPDGTFKGDRAATRWETAMVVARLLSKMEAEDAAFALKVDAENLKKLCEEYKQELDALGVRITNLEDGYGKMDKRVTALEHVRFYGNFQSIYMSQGAGGSLVTAGQRNVPTVNDWTNGRPITNGNAVSSLVRLGVRSEVMGFDIGTEFAGYNSMGDPIVDQYWGVTPPYSSNPYTAASGGAAVVSQNAPFTRFVFDNFWMRHKDSGNLLMLGSFTPKNSNPITLQGVPNPNINAPYILPFYGVNFSGKTKAKNPISYEVLISRLPSASNAVNPNTNFYRTWLMSGSVGLEFANGKININYLRSCNDPFSEGIAQGAGLITIPTRPDVLGVRSQGWYSTIQGANVVNVGPQVMDTFGVDIDWNFHNNWKFTGEYGTSVYDPDMANQVFNTSASGSTYRVGLQYKPKNWTFNLDYVNTDPTYDAMLFRYPTTVNIPVFLPYSTYYTNYYQLHDYNTYTNNREGLKFYGDYSFNRGKVVFNYSRLQQKSVSTPEQMSSVGSVETFFPELRLGGDQRGVTQNYGVALHYSFLSKLVANIGYYHYDIDRAAITVDDMDLAENIAMLNLGYPINNKYSLFGGLSNVQYSGHYADQTNQQFTQNIPYIGAAWTVNKDALLTVTLRSYDYRNTITQNSDWQGLQSILEFRMNF